MTTSRAMSRVLRLLVAVLLTVYVLWTADPEAVLRVGRRAELRWILASLGLVVIDRALMAYRWIVLVRVIDQHARPPLDQVLRVFFLSTFAGTFLPASIGGDVVRAYGLSRLRVATGPAVASVLMDRVLGVLSIVLVGGIGLLLLRRSDLASNRSTVISLTAATVACTVAAAAVFSETVARLVQRVVARLPVAHFRQLATELSRATRAYAHHHQALLNVLAGSVGVQVLRVVQAYCLGRALAIDVPPVLYFGLIPLILLIMLLPLTINGIGTSQVAFVWFFGRVGVGEAEAFALSVLFVALGIVGNLPGGILYALGQAGSRP